MKAIRRIPRVEIRVGEGVVELQIEINVLLHQQRLRGRVDVAGALLSVIGMVALVYGLIRAADTSWTNATTIGALCLAVASLAVFA